jgi:hypothetical protein
MGLLEDRQQGIPYVTCFFSSRQLHHTVSTGKQRQADWCCHSCEGQTGSQTLSCSLSAQQHSCYYGMP